MLSRIIFLFTLTTEADDRAAAAPRSGGWSEGWWRDGVVGSDEPNIPVLAQKRALLLGKQASIIGYRIGVYSPVGNKLVPQGTSTGRFLYPGKAGVETDVPQMALMMAATAEGKSNSSRFSIRGVPDAQVSKGEYQPDTAYKMAMTQFCNQLADFGWGFVGRKLDNAFTRNQGIANGKITCGTPPGTVVGESFLRLLHIKDTNGDPVSGSYRIKSVVGTDFLLDGLDTGIVAKPNGGARLDELVFCNFDRVKPDSICVRKIGRPSKGYRGRASKR